MSKTKTIQKELSALLANLKTAYDNHKAEDSAAMKMWQSVVKAVKTEKMQIVFSGGRMKKPVIIIDNNFLIGRCEIDTLRFMDPAENIQQRFRMRSADIVEVLQ